MRDHIKSRGETAEELRLKWKKNLLFIYIGISYSILRIQLNDVTFSRKEVSEIQNFINAERLSKDEDEIPYMTTSIKADSEVTMGIVTDVKTELRKVNALKINYSTKKAKDTK